MPLALLCALAAERDGSWPALALVTRGWRKPAGRGGRGECAPAAGGGGGRRGPGLSRPGRAARVPERPHPMHGSDGLGDAAAAVRRRNGGGGGCAGPARRRRGGPETGVLGLGPADRPGRGRGGGAGARWPGSGKVVLMAGGPSMPPGNAPGGAEYNAYGDPAALAVVLGRGALPAWCPSDVTRQVALRPGPVGRLWRRPARRSAVRVATMLAVYHGPDDGGSGRPLHDPLAWLALARPELFRIERVALSVDADSGATRRGGPLTADVGAGVWTRKRRGRRSYDALESALFAPTRTPPGDAGRGSPGRRNRSGRCGAARRRAPARCPARHSSRAPGRRTRRSRRRRSRAGNPRPPAPPPPRPRRGRSPSRPASLTHRRDPGG